MNIRRTLCLSLLLAARAGIATAQTPSDSTSISNDSITWNKELDGVVVKAQRQLIKQDIDRIGYDVQADEESKTQTVLDMLRKVPMVTVDGEDNIKVKGNSSFKVYKNGHYSPSLSKNAKDIFKSMPAAMVKRIEVITDPGAREDAEGVEAILNIVMVDGSKFDGITGVVAASYSSNNNPRFNTSLTGQIGKLLLSANYIYSGMSSRGTENTSDTERTFLKTGNRLVEHSENTNPGNLHMVNVDASYDIDSLNLLSASFGGFFYKINFQGDGTTSMFDRDNNLLYSYNNHYWMPGYSHHSWDGRLDYEHKTRRKGERFTLSYMLALTRQHTDQENEYTNLMNTSFPYTSTLQTARERFTEHTFQADWLRPLGKGHQIEVGTKYIYRNNNSHNTQDYRGKMPETDSQFEHTTQVVAAYADYIFRKEKWSARAGLRYEYSYMQGKYPDGSNETFRHHLNDWVPQASLKYQLTERQSLKLNYTTSINRPGISYLNPAVIVSPNVIQSGNPDLTSSHSQTLNLIYMYTCNRLTVQLSSGYRFYNGGIASIQRAEGDIRYETYDNVQRYRRFSFDNYVQWRPFDGTSIYLDNSIYYLHYENPNLGYRNYGWIDSYYLSLSQQLPWKLRLSANSWGYIGHYPQNVYNIMHSWIGCSVSLQRSFLKEDRLTVRISINHPFDKFKSNKSETINGDLRDLQTSCSRGRGFFINVNYRFGSLKASVKKTEHSINNDDMIGGISKGN